MKTRDVVGRTIVRIEQERFWNDHTASWCVHVKGFELDNGSYIHFSTTETGSDYATEATVTKNRKED
jgi:hypothetical protein